MEQRIEGESPMLNSQKKTVQNCDTTVVMGHRVGLDKNEARWVGDRGQPSYEKNAVLSGWHNARARSGQAMVGIIMMAGNRWVSGNGCHQINCERDVTWSCQAKIN